MPINFKSIGQRIKTIRKSKRMSQAELAERTNRSVPYISHIETGNKNVSLITLVEIGNVLGVTTDALLLGNQEHDQTECCLELAHLITDCNADERRLIYEIAFAVKNNLRINCLLQRNDSQN
jgi:transcriptional regulator with XRE-family HTH domain